MFVVLEMYVDDEWYPYGTYDLSDDRDLQAFTQACVEQGSYGKSLRTVRK